MIQGKRPRVAVVRGDDRRECVARALELVGDDVADAVKAGAGEVLVKPNLVSDRRQLASTHPDTFSAALDAVFAAGARRVTVAEGATDASNGFDRFGYKTFAGRRAVRFFDVNRDETDWEPIELTSVEGRRWDCPEGASAEGKTLVARLSKTVASSPCRVSLAVAKTHVTSVVTLALKNMLSSLHPDDRVMMHGYAGGGNGYKGWKRPIVEFLKGDSFAVNALTRTLGRVRNAANAFRREKTLDLLSPAEFAYLRSVESMNRNLVALTARVKPHVAVVDGFLGMHREGPRHGTPIKHRTVVAGTDAVAVDAVAAYLMGFHPEAIGYLRYAREQGLGASAFEVEIVGDPLESCRRRFVPHSNDPIQRLWRQIARPIPSEPTALAGPHFAVGSPARPRNGVTP